MACTCCEIESVASVLLSDIHEVIEGRTFIATDELVHALIENNPRQWSAENHYGRDLTPQRLGRLLGVGLGIRSTRDHTDKRGYCAAAFVGQGGHE